MEYALHVLILIGIYSILSTSLNLIIGYTGILSIAQAAFYGIGAYVVALLALNLQTPVLLNVVCGITACGLTGAMVGMPSLRIRDDYFVIATFAFQMITFGAINNCVSATGGPMGLPGIPQPAIFGLRVSTNAGFLVVTVILSAIVLGVTHRIVMSPFGRVLKAIRNDEVFALSLGKNIAVFKVTVFVVGAAMASIAGALYAYYISFVDPTSFTVMESIFIISIVIIGGAGSLWGPVIGSVVLVTLPEALRFIGMPSSVAANVRQMLYGSLLVAFLLWHPQGFIGQCHLGKADLKQ